jgi:hypothetical protein
MMERPRFWLVYSARRVMMFSCLSMSGWLAKRTRFILLAVRAGRVLLTRNYRDFDDLHDLAMALQGHHPGILVVRMDNDPRRDLKPRGIVRAIGKLLASGAAVADNNHVLNHWR